jgi:agmatine deiminase
MPAEWEPHECCLMGWPARAELWRERFEQAKDDYAAIARAIARFERVVLLAAPAALAEASARCGADVEVREIALDDSWLRDTGPLFVRDADGLLAGVDFEFNGWGEKYTPYADDAALARRVLEQLGVPRHAAHCVLEGGAVSVDGEGTLITTESVLLNANRNPGLTRAQLEGLLREYLGAELVIWLSAGLCEDRDTDGHVDNVCHFIAPGRVLVQTVADRANPNFERLQANARLLRESRDALGRRLEVLELPLLPYLPESPPPVVAPYLNFYLANGAVIVPVTGAETDAQALELIAAALPGREVVPVPGATLAHGGGGVHCITQQVPR